MRVLAGFLAMVFLLCGSAGAERKKNPTEAWVMCQPDSEVNVREFPNRHAAEVARVFPGDRIELTGKKKGRWYHCTIPSENGEGWIRGDFLVFTEPEIYPEGKIFETTNGKLYARYSIRGNKRKTLKKGVKVTVYMMSEDWAITSQGFIMSKFLEEAAPDDS